MRDVEASGSTAGKIPSSEIARDRFVVASRCAKVVAGAEQRQQRRVPRQHAEIAVGARDLHFVDAFVDERSVRRHDLKVKVGGQVHTKLEIG